MTSVCTGSYATSARCRVVAAPIVFPGAHVVPAILMGLGEREQEIHPRLQVLAAGGGTLLHLADLASSKR